MRMAPNGCGEPILDEDGNVQICCGDHIDTENENCTVIPVLCDKCWEKERKERKEQESSTEMKGGID